MSWVWVGTVNKKSKWSKKLSKVLLRIKNNITDTKWIIFYSIHVPSYVFLLQTIIDKLTLAKKKTIIRSINNLEILKSHLLVMLTVPKTADLRLFKSAWISKFSLTFFLLRFSLFRNAILFPEHVVLLYYVHHKLLTVMVWYSHPHVCPLSYIIILSKPSSISVHLRALFKHYIVKKMSSIKVGTSLLSFSMF